MTVPRANTKPSALPPKRFVPLAGMPNPESDGDGPSADHRGGHALTCACPAGAWVPAPRTSPAPRGGTSGSAPRPSCSFPEW